MTQQTKEKTDRDTKRKKAVFDVQLFADFYVITTFVLKPATNYKSLRHESNL